MPVLRKVYKSLNLEFRLHSLVPQLYTGYLNGKLYEENVPGFGWTTATFSLEQLNTLSNW